MSDEKLKKEYKVGLPFDRRHPDDSKNYGIHGLDIWFILKGEKGAVQYGVTFPVYLPHVAKELQAKGKTLDRIYGFDVGYHARMPQYEGQTIMADCDLTPEGKCFYDGSSLRASDWTEQIFSVVGEKPEKLLWEKLYTEYVERFGEP